MDFNDSIKRRKFRIIIMVSGRGSNMEAIIKSIQNKILNNVEVALVISDNPTAKALEICNKNGIKGLYLHPGDYKTKLEGEAERDYIEIIMENNPDLIVLAGFMRIIKTGFINGFPNKIINIHPSLLPKYPGLHTHRRAIEAGDKEAGCTVHFVSDVTDGGKRIMQAKVPVLPADTEETLSVRVLEKEHIILPKVIGMFAESRINYETFPDNPIMLA